MRAVVMNTPGKPEVLRPAEIARPVITQPQEILVRLKAAGVNPVDTKLRARGTYYPDRYPTILGCDGTGIVEAIGSAVTRFKPGDEVYYCYGGIGGTQGNYAEYAVIPEYVAALKPKSLNFEQAAAAPLVLITAWESLFDRAHLQPGQTVLIHAGAGGVGHVAIQLAHDKDARVCTTVGNSSKAEFVNRLGAEKVIDYKQQDFVTTVLDWTNGQGVDIAFDTVGGETFNRSISAVRYGGDLVTLLQPEDTASWKEARTRNLRISLELMLTPMHQGLTDALRHQGQILQRCAQLFDEGKLKIHVAHTFPLAEAAAAHRLIEQGGMTGKIVLTID
ncbi:MAG: zinc-dependent alcohol dehydrogenase family protein [Gammaproteobacteria bacterium]|nr:zinc-dependent alcohol dehydrogenase family protein [Gammaproteobacteria bacterium]